MTMLFCVIQTMCLQDPGSPGNAVKETSSQYALVRRATGDSQKTSLEIQYAVLPIRFARKDVHSIGLEVWTDCSQLPVYVWAWLAGPSVAGLWLPTRASGLRL